MAMPDPPLISVALCVCNGERFLRAQLDSVLAQEDVRLEVVAVDDASTDGSLALLREYAARDARIRVEANPRNLGASASFERAMGFCRGDFIAPCDQDDVWDPRKLATLLAAIGDGDLAYCDSAYTDADGHLLGRRVSDDLPMLSGREPLRFVFANSVSGHATLLRRELIAAARPFPEDLYHDWWLALQAAARGGVRYVDAPLVLFRRHAAAASNVGRAGRRLGTGEWLQTRRRLLQGLDAAGLPGQARAHALRVALEHALRGGSAWPLWRALWPLRACVPRRTGVPALDVLQLQLKFLRKLRRARRRGSHAATPPRG